MRGSKGRKGGKSGRALPVLVVLLGAGMAVGWAQDEVLVDGKPLAGLIKKLKSENRGEQLRAAQALSKVTPEEAPKIVPELIPVLRSERENDRFVAAQALGTYGAVSRGAVPELLVMLGGTQFERNRAAAAKALGQILKDAPASEEIEKVVQALMDKLGDKYSDVRREAVYACGMIGPAAKAFLPLVPPLLKEFNPGHAVYEGYPVRCAAAWAVGRMGPHAAPQIDLMISMLHADGHVNPNLAWAIGQIGPVHGNVVSNLMDKIESAGRPGDYGELKIQAYGALARFGEKSVPAVALTRRLLKDTVYPPDAALRTAMVQMLGALGAGAKEAVPEIQAQIALAQGKAGDPAYAPLLEEALKAFKAVTGQEPPAATAKK